MIAVTIACGLIGVVVGYFVRRPLDWLKPTKGPEKQEKKAAAVSGPFRSPGGPFRSPGRAEPKAEKTTEKAKAPAAPPPKPIIWNVGDKVLIRLGGQAQTVATLIGFDAVANGKIKAVLRLPGDSERGPGRQWVCPVENLARASTADSSPEPTDELAEKRKRKGKPA